MAIYDGLADCQAEPSATSVTAGGGSEEAIEYVLELLVGNTDTGVSDRQLNTVMLTRQGELDMTVFRGEFYGVAQEIAHELHQAHSVAPNNGRRTCFQVDGYLLRIADDPSQLNAFANDLRKVDLVEFDF